MEAGYFYTLRALRSLWQGKCLSGDLNILPIVGRCHSLIPPLRFTDVKALPKIFGGFQVFPPRRALSQQAKNPRTHSNFILLLLIASRNLISLPGIIVAY